MLAPIGKAFESYKERVVAEKAARKKVFGWDNTVHLSAMRFFYLVHPSIAEDQNTHIAQ